LIKRSTWKTNLGLCSIFYFLTRQGSGRLWGKKNRRKGEKEGESSTTEEPSRGMWVNALGIDMVLVMLIMGEMKSISHIERERERERGSPQSKAKNKVLATTATTRNNSSSSTSEKQHHLIYLFALPFQPNPHQFSLISPSLSLSLSLSHCEEEKEEKTRKDPFTVSLYRS